VTVVTGSGVSKMVEFASGGIDRVAEISTCTATRHSLNYR
jgi:hypothetical protein